MRRLPTSRRRARDEIDDIFADDEPIAASRTRVLRPVGNGGSDVQVHLVIPRNFNDAQQVADKFKRTVPVILNLQTTDHELSKRLIDFSSGLTYALDGGMQRIAEKIFLLTPRNVEVSAEEKARLLEKGFFNQPSRPDTLPRRDMIVGFGGSGNMAAAMARGWSRRGRTRCSSPTRGPDAPASCRELGGEAVGSNARAGRAMRTSWCSR